MQKVSTMYLRKHLLQVGFNKWILPKFASSLNAAAETNQQNEYIPSYIHGASDIPLIHRNIGQHLRQAVEKYPNNEALVSCHEDKRYTYSEIMDKVDRLAAAFYQIGLEKGDRVGMWAPNGCTSYLTALAVARAGMILVGINPAYQIPELKHALKKVGVKALVTAEGFRGQSYYEMLKVLIPELAASSPGYLNSTSVPSLKSVIIDATEKKIPGTFTFQEMFEFATKQQTSQIESLQQTISPTSGACLLFTSGTTGQPKAALLSHFALVNNSWMTAYRYELDRKNHRICTQVSLFHTFGLVDGIFGSMNFGSTTVLPGAEFQASESLQAIVNEKCTAIYGTPTMYVDLLNELRDKNVELPPIDLAVFGAASCSPQLMLDVETMMSVKYVRSGYGMTELSCSVFVSDRGDRTEASLDSVGLIIDHCEAKVVDGEGHTVPFGTAGELYVRGYGTMLGFWDDEGATNAVLGVDRWFKTGDQFVLRSDGYGKIVGRIKEMIIRGGTNIYPKEIEDVLNTIPGVLETHCIGVPDDRLGEEVCAYIRVDDSEQSKMLNMERIEAFCKDKLAHYKIPKYLRIVDHFPKTMSFKIQKFKLLEMYLNK